LDTQFSPREGYLLPNWSRNVAQKLIAALSFLVLFLVSRPGWSSDLDNSGEILNKVKLNNRAAIEAIHTMFCEYTILPAPGTSEVDAMSAAHLRSKPGRFWKQGVKYRIIKHESDTQASDCVYRGDGTCLMAGHFATRNARLGEELNTKPLLLSVTTPHASEEGDELWPNLLFTHWGPAPVSFLVFDKLLDEKHQILLVEEVKSDGNPKLRDVHVVLSHANCDRMEFWFSAAHNYLIHKTYWVPIDRSVHWESEVLDFAEPRPGVFLPTFVERRYFENFKAKPSAVRTSLTNLKVNVPLARNAFRIPHIAGMECDDLIRNKMFKVDAEGRRVGPEVDQIVGGVQNTQDLNNPMATITESSNSTPLPSSEPWPVWSWLLLGSTCLFLLGVTAAIVRRWRANKR
jgi:hypothetical protein